MNRPKAGSGERTAYKGHERGLLIKSVNEKPGGQSIDMALAIARAAWSKKAADIVILDMAELIGITDFFVICSGNTERQVSTIVDEITKAMRESGVKPFSVEGRSEMTWVLIDYLDVVVHVFRAEEREFYDLERLWKDAPRIPFDNEEEIAAQGG